MPGLGYAAEVGIKRTRSIARGLMGLFFATGFGLIAHGMVADLLGDLRYLDHRDLGMRRAHFAWMTCHVALTAVMAAMTVSIVARSLRAALGMPPRRRRALARVLAPLRIAGGCVMWVALWFRGMSEYRFLYDSSPLGVLAVGLVMCAVFALDVPLLVANGLAALRARAPMLRARFVDLDRLPTTGRVHVRARLTSPYVLGEPATIRVEGKGGTPLRTELDPARLVVVAELEDREEHGGVTTLVIPAGTEVRLIGEIEAGDAYRAEPRLHAGGGKVHLYFGAATMTRRLLLAATIELFAAIGLSSCVLGVLGFFGYLALRVATH